MLCVLCHHDELEAGTVVTMILERGSTTLVIKEVPVRVCRNCGESYIDEAVTAQLLENAEQAAQSGPRRAGCR